MCTKTILDLLRKAAVVSYTATNTALYVMAPELALQGLITNFIDLATSDMDSATKAKIAEGLAYGVVIPLAVGLLQSTYGSYTKVVDDYKNSIGKTEQPLTRWRKFSNYGGAVLKAAASCASWYTLWNKIPYVGDPIGAAVTTALSVPGNLYTQIAFLSQEMQQPRQRLTASGTEPLLDSVSVDSAAPVPAAASSNSSLRATSS